MVEELNRAGADRHAIGRRHAECVRSERDSELAIIDAAELNGLAGLNGIAQQFHGNRRRRLGRGAFE